MNSKKSKTTILFLFIVVGFIIFLSIMFYRASIDRKLPNMKTSELNTAIRGSIITKDGFNVATSQKLYTIKVDTRSIDPNKKELFIKLFSLYSLQNESDVRKLLNSTKGSLTLSKKVDTKTAMHLRELSKKLYQKKIFIPIKGSSFIQGLDIFETKESRKNRTYMGYKALTPVLGYMIQKDDNSIGSKGIEKFYDEYLLPIQDENLVGERDVGSNIIFTNNSSLKSRIDGYNIGLNISLKFQTMLEKIVDNQKEFLDAKEVVASVMDTKSGKILALASSSRYDPSKITRNDYNALNPTATEYAYEIGSVFKPFIFAILLNNNKVNPLELVNTHNGKYKLGNKIITDTHPKQYMSAEDVIVYSSNIGMIQLTQRLSGADIYKGLMNFGFSRKSGIDLPYEQSGMLPSVVKLNSETYKATISYGYGLNATFMQLLKAYNVFNNKGYEVVPKISSYIEKNGKKYMLPIAENKQIISQDIAKIMKRILIKTVNKGTGTKAITPGLEVGGKTGTAHIATKGSYGNIYNGSFFGFANDYNGNRYTIGVLVREPKKKYYHFGSQSALPVFKSTVDLLISEKYLTPNNVLE